MLCGLIFVVFSFCVWSSDIGKINAYDKIMTENRKKRENVEHKA